ncbi:DNA recombination protein RmuC [Paracoccus sp. (in: a-proteobacteria)]|uniref:DNA recombination protein RmuC n=1 Tax=Paracoccus sp. TaxID=267 RepID=UPI0026E0E073|nr:DNA recombination protein RmuC [Paracoccus sp. (in: a-proteobacteria)]MDO5370960.1 DNA recombination protein RmuC [Paracoccus sp. (in: a-proteobacteria)]
MWNDPQLLRLLAILLALAGIVLAVLLSRRSAAVTGAETALREARAEAQAAGLRAAEATARLEGQVHRLTELGTERDDLRDAVDQARTQAETLARDLAQLREREGGHALRLAEIGDERDGLRDAVQGAHDRVATLERELGKAATRLDADRARIAELEGERGILRRDLDEARATLAAQERELAEIRLAAAKDREAAERDLTLLRDLREEMTGQFRLMADESLRRQGADLEKTHSERLAAMLTPFREQVQGFQTELQARNKIVDEERAMLREQIDGLHRRSEEIGRDAVALTRALKGEKQRQGAWGEMILERVLEGSGLERGTHYDTQESWRAEDGKLWRPDVIVRLPRKKVLVIDSKVSLNDYERAVNAEMPEERDAALKRHVTAIRTHVTTLSEKGYQQIDNASVDYVLMFIPIEGAFSEALRVDAELGLYALNRRIVLATPTTLMPMLRTVDHIWTVERRESNAMEIADRAGKLYDKLALFVDAMEDVGRCLDGASRAHNQAMDRLTRGSGNVVGQVEKLRLLGARAQKRIALDHDAEQTAEVRLLEAGE